MSGKRCLRQRCLSAQPIATRMLEYLPELCGRWRLLPPLILLQQSMHPSLKPRSRSLVQIDTAGVATRSRVRDLGRARPVDSRRFAGMCARGFCLTQGGETRNAIPVCRSVRNIPLLLAKAVASTFLSCLVHRRLYATESQAPRCGLCATA